MSSASAKPSTPRLDAILTEIKTTAGAPPTAKTCRAILSGAMKFAVRYGAISVNPVREVDTIEALPKNPPRALTGLGTGGPSHIRPDRRRTDLVEVEDRMLLLFGERALRGLDG